MVDAFAPNIPDEMILRMLEIPRNNPDGRFLVQTKNPERLCRLFTEYNPFTTNTTIGVTIESNRDYPDYSQAPLQYVRLYWTAMLSKAITNPILISIEPILDFGMKEFVTWIERIKPSMVACGYDNYSHHLIEPTLAKTEELISRLEKFTIVYRKTIKKAWNEK